MDDYSWREEKNDYRAPWLKLNKEQMSDPFGWLLSQRSVNVREILQQMGYDDRQIDLLLHPERATKMKPKFLEMRQRIGQKAVQTYLKQSFYNELKENKQSVKINESQLRKIVTESVKKVLKEDGLFKKSPSLSSDGDERLAVNNAIHELTEAVSVLNKFLENGMMEKRLLEMADTYCQRGYSHITNLINLAN